MPAAFSVYAAEADKATTTIDNPFDPIKTKVLTLGCCKCVGDPINALDLSTKQNSSWTVSNDPNPQTGGVPVDATTAPNSAWATPPSSTGTNPPVKWVRPPAGFSGATSTGGTKYYYKLNFKIQDCVVAQKVKLTITDLRADNQAKVTLFRSPFPAYPTPFANPANCGISPYSEYCFLYNSSQSAPTVYTSTSQMTNTPIGNYTLVVEVTDTSGVDTGMFIRAKLDGQCSRQLVKGKDFSSNYYDQSTNTLSVQELTAFGNRYSVELLNQGDYTFKLQGATPIEETVDEEPAPAPTSCPSAQANPPVYCD
ncbi:MAG: hypothetical protein ABL903_09930 [Methylococcales bacterium]